jgi:hypothetical protein
MMIPPFLPSLIMKQRALVSEIERVNLSSDLLSDSIEEVLGNLLGERAKRAIYTCLERQGLPQHQIPEHLSRFDAFLEDAFGRGGRVIETQIAKQLHIQLGLELIVVPHYGLTDYVDMASRRLSGVERLGD